jgi:hypothetical protein
MKSNDGVNRSLDASQWRAFQVFLSELDDRDFRTARRQLDRELVARSERDTNALRLFYSSLTNEELQNARQEIAFLSSPLPKAKRRGVDGVRSPRIRKPRT